MKFAYVALALAAINTPVHAGEWVIGIGAPDFSDSSADDSVAIIGEIHGDPFHSFGQIDLSWAGAAVIHDEGDFFVGAGISALWQSNSPWFVEASIMPGYFDASSASTDLGGEFEIRSLIGVGRQINDNTRVSLAIDHKSNADTGRSNPGVDTISLRLRKSF